MPSCCMEVGSDFGHFCRRGVKNWHILEPFEEEGLLKCNFVLWDGVGYRKCFFCMGVWKIPKVSSPSPILNELGLSLCVKNEQCSPFWVKIRHFGVKIGGWSG